MIMKMTFAERTFLIVAFMLTLGVFCIGTLPVGYYQPPVTLMTNDWIVFVPSNCPGMVVTNGMDVSNSAPVRIRAGSTLTVDTTSTLSNAHVRGALIIEPTYAVITVPTNNGYNIKNISLLIVTNCSTNSIVFSGFTNGIVGQVVDVVNRTGTNMTFLCTNSLSASINQFDLMGIHDTVTNTVGKGSARFIYDGSSSNWNLQSIVY